MCIRDRGNIELPGFEDNKLLDPNLNKTIVAWRKRGNIEFKETMRVVANKRGEAHNLAVKRGCNENRDNTYQAETNTRAEVKAKLSAKLIGRKKTPEHEAKVAASNRAKPTDPNWKAAHQAGIEKRDRPFHTPYGVFPSLNAAARYVKEHGLLGNAIKKFEKWKETDPTNYYFEEK